MKNTTRSTAQEITTLNDANLLNFNENNFPDWFEDEFTISVGKGRDDYSWTKKSHTFAQFFGHLTKHAVGKKDGLCFMQGELVENKSRRTKTAVSEMNLLALDIDHGAPISEIIEKIKKAGLFALIYTSHSHMKTVTEIKSDEIRKKLKIEDPEHELDGDDLYDYLTVFKGYDPRIVEAVEAVGPFHKSEGLIIEAHHAPMPKYRVVFVLSEPFKPAEAAATHRDGMAYWARKYAGVAEMLETFYDRSCMDVSRLFYFPRHEKNAPFEIHMINGNTLCLDEIEDGNIKGYEPKRTTGNSVLDAFEDLEGDDDDYEYIPGLKKFFAQYGATFNIADYFESVEEPRAEREQGKLIFECPFDAEHSNSGDEEDMGFCVWNPGVDNAEAAKASCQHDSCHNRDRLMFVDEIMKRYDHKIADLKPFVDGEGTDTYGSLEDALKDAKVSSAGEHAEDDSDLSDDEKVSRLEGLIGKIETNDKKSLVNSMRYLLSIDLDSYDVSKHLKKMNKVSEMGKRDFQALWKELSAKHKEENPEADDFSAETKKKLKEYNKRFAAIGDEREVRILDLKKWNRGNQNPYMAKQAFFDTFNSERVAQLTSYGDVKMVPLSKVWFDWPKRRTYSDGVIFDPNPANKNKNKDSFNTWTGFEVDSSIEGNCDILIEHIWENICHKNEIWYNYLMTWIAHIVQRPWEIPGVMVVLKGKKGTGKSILGEKVLKKYIFGKFGMKTPNIEALLGQYNSRIEGKVFCLLEEAFWGGDKKHESGLKDIITSDEAELRAKYKGDKSFDNFLRLMAVSNEDYIVPATEEERRYFILQLSEARMQDTEYFEDLVYQMEHENGISEFMHKLETWPEPKEGWRQFLFKVPKTPWLKDQVSEALPYWEHAMMDDFNQGVFGELRNEDIEEFTLNYDESTRVPKKVLKAHWDKYTLRSPHKSKNTTFKDFLEKRLGIDSEDKPMRCQGVDGPVRCILVPPLKDLRPRIASLLNQEVLTEEIFEFEEDNEKA